MTNSSIDDPETAVAMKFTTLQTCSTGNPCALGQMCRFQSHSTFCHACGINQIGNGQTCTVCPPRTGPNADHTACLDCSAGKSSALGLCDQCGPGSHASKTGMPVCLPCPDKTRPNVDRTSCQCATGSYNGTTIRTICFHNGYDEDRVSDGLNLHAVSGCLNCPDDVTGEECLVCNGGGTFIQAGFTAPQIANAGHGDAFVSVFRCHPDIDIARKRCPGGGSRRLAEKGPGSTDSQCAEGYEGQLCGGCADDW